MRKAQKEQAESLISLLEQAHEEIRKAAVEGNVAVALTLLTQCQDGAISLGELIEKTEGEGFPTITLLEEYCEFVYQIHQAVTEGERSQIHKTYKNLRKALIRIKNSVRSDIRVRREVVFLPYKASMWDSLESIWKAADEDPDCDAYVIPIPYYDKNPDGSFRELHYEGSEYPKYVPVVWYQDYDFEARRPDMVFIHNPYDDCNYVTSVHPSFYSSVLKQYTERLVYVPYYVLGEPDPDREESLEKLEHFVTVPGVYNADRVIVQSEAMRRAYIKILTRAAGAETKSTWKEKILGLGSPKFDKVAETKPEDLEIPPNWRRVIEKADGSRKKIVFYNTSVVALLEHNEKMLEKMCHVFEVFRENQEEVALLWRPHPLVKATIESMRPALWKAYEKLFEQYQAERWGIYDDTTDLNRAIAISDGYYGDASSVAELYQKTGKPVMMQDVENNGHKLKK